MFSPLIEWLYLYGYDDLHVSNLAWDRSFYRGPIHYRVEDITDTRFRDGCIDGITCLSVLEHGVDDEQFLREAARLLGDEGTLVVSVDFTSEQVDTDLRAFGREWQPYSDDDVNMFLKKAESMGFAVPDVSMAGSAQPINWREHEYTFLVFSLSYNTRRT